MAEPDTGRVREHAEGARGTRQAMHRSLRHLSFGTSTLLAVLLLPLATEMLLWAHIGDILNLWQGIFRFWITRFGFDEAQMPHQQIIVFGKTFTLLLPALPAFPPSQTGVYANLAACLLGLLASRFLPTRALPLTYALRVALLIQASASFYFLVHPDRPPYEVPAYLSGILLNGVYFLFLLSPLLAAIYYIFNFAFWQKCAVTLLMTGYFIIWLPFLLLAHAFILSYVSLLCMPLLYLMFGALLNTLMFVGWYGWAMSWRGK